jgi:hypothetical protein
MNILTVNLVLSTFVFWIAAQSCHVQRAALHGPGVLDPGVLGTGAARHALPDLRHPHAE